MESIHPRSIAMALQNPIPVCQAAALLPATSKHFGGTAILDRIRKIIAVDHDDQQSRGSIYEEQRAVQSRDDLADKSTS
jgi:hypothetical protein